MTTQKKKDTKSIETQLPKRSRFVTWLYSFPAPVAALLTAAVALVLLSPFELSIQTFNLPKEGDVARETIIAPFNFDVPKPIELLEVERKAAAARVLQVVDFDTDGQTRVRRSFLGLREALAALSEKNASDSLRSAIKLRLATEFSEKTLQTLQRRQYLLDDALFQAQTALQQGISAVLLIPSLQELAVLQKQYNASFNQHLFYDQGFVTLRRDSVEMPTKLSDLPVKEVVLEHIVGTLRDQRKLDPEALNALYEVLFAYLQPNIAVNGEETSRRRQTASASVLAIKAKVIKDTEIIRKHQVVSAEVVEKIVALKRALQKNSARGERVKLLAGYAGKILLVLVLLLFAALYLKSIRLHFITSSRHLWGLASIVVIQAAAIRLGLYLVPRLFRGGEMSSIVPEYLIPTVVAAILAAILFDFEVSIIVSLFFSMYVGVVLGFKYSIFVYALLGGLVAGYANRGVRYRWDFFKAMPPVLGIYAVTILLWHLIAYEFPLMEVVQNLGLGLTNLVVSTLLVMMLTPVFENLFGISTNMTLVELADMNHPILKKLSIEAAGTYNHSVLVGNLAESAAQSIGANALLARVASYYHDIGKIEKSDYFIENLVGDKNMHRKLAPSMSALIICSHVKDGVELARQFKLPLVIQNAIMQHHGTSTVSYFYEKAREQDQHNQVQEEDFRYPGPVPQTRENAIIMLADSVEAASRSLGTSSPKLLRELVKKIIRDKFSARQLDQCNLTLRDLDKIVEGFMPVLQGIFHSRIEYPIAR